MKHNKYVFVCCARCRHVQFYPALRMIGVSNITNRTDPNSLRSRVFVGNLNTLHMQKPQLEAIFSKFGAIIGISVHKGYAFIQYANEAHARAAVKAEDMNTYYGMKLDVTIASEPKNRKRGRPAATQNACSSAQNFLDLALQAQALAAVGGQFSHLGFSNNAAPPLSLTASQYPAAAAAAAAAAANLTGLIPTMNVMNSGVPPLLGQATMGGGSVGSQKSPSGTGYKSLMPNPHRGSGLNSLSASSSSAKRTRLETGSSGGGGGGSANSSGLPAGAVAARSANLVSLVTPKQDPFPPNTRVAPRTSTTASSSASLCVTSRLQSATSRPSTASNSHSNNTQKYTHGIAAKFSDMKVGGGSQKADRRQNSNGSAHAGGTESQQPGQRQQQQRSPPYSEDILICGQCRQLFESVDVLIAHKMAGCSINKENELTCRCKRNGEPNCLDCAYCGDTFSSAWELVYHCHTEHSLTIYAIPSQPPSPSSTAATSETARPTSPKRQHVSKDLQRDRGYCSSSSSVFSRPAGPAAVSASPPARADEQTEEEEEYDFEVSTPQADVCEEEEEVTAAAATPVSEAEGSTRSRGGSVDEQDGSNQAAESAEAPVVEHGSPVEEEEAEEDNEESSEEAAQDQESEQQHGKQEKAESTQHSNGLVEDSAKDGAEALTEVKCAAVLEEEDGRVPRPDRQQYTSFRRERRGSEHGRNETCTDDEEGEEYVADRSG